MSKFYEVRTRDGAARIGKLMLNGGMQTETPRMLRVEREEELAVVGVEDANFNELASEETWHAPRGTVLLPEVHPLVTKLGTNTLYVDFFVLAFASSMLRSPRDFVRRIIDARNAIPPDVALWVPAIATVENAALLFYMGVDIIDETNAVIKGYQDIYQMEEGESSLSKLEDLPCTCPICTALSIDEFQGTARKTRAVLLARHNSLLLAKEVKKTRVSIRAGGLREYVEQKVRASSFLTAVLRILDLQEARYFERRTPVARNRSMKVNTMESLKRIEVKRFSSRVLNRYEPPAREILLILPCSARKPYSRSNSHMKFIDTIADYRGHIHEVILTSPLGVVPRELEAVYPAAFYDIPVTGYWDAEEREWVSSCLRAYLKKNQNNYEVVVAHLRGAYKDICAGVAADLGVELVFTCESNSNERLTSKEALNRLKERITCAGRKRLSSFEEKASMLKAMADYQMGLGAGNELVAREAGEKLGITGKFPYYKLISNKEVLARIVPQYGVLALTVRAARRISNLNSYYRVEIGDFVPAGSILAPGVLNADPQIRVNDEVVFWGEKAFGVGRAKMSGWEMVQSRRGMAVQVRAVEVS
ncbi:MAG: archaeosine synthase subunit alpha [Halobacteriota archaeon]